MVNEKQINNSLEKAIFQKEVQDVVEKRLLEVIKCGVGPSTGYIDGVKYSKDNKQRYHRIVENYDWGEHSYYDADNGEIEQKNIDAQNKVKWTDEERDEFSALANDFANTVGFQMYGDGWYDSINDPDAYFDDYGGSSAVNWEYIEDYTQRRVDGIGVIEKMFEKAPGMQGDTILYGLDMLNPNLKEGDVFELDTFFCGSFKEAVQENKYNPYSDSATDINIDYIRNENGQGIKYYASAMNDRLGLRETNYRNNYKSDYSDESSKDLPYNNAYKVKIMTSDGTPVLINQGNLAKDYANEPVYEFDTGLTYGDGVGDAMEYWDGNPTSKHDVFLNKGQKVRLVRVDHEKQTAIYQTVDE